MWKEIEKDKRIGVVRTERKERTTEWKGRKGNRREGKKEMKETRKKRKKAYVIGNLKFRKKYMDLKHMR